MTAGITYSRRLAERTVVSAEISDVFAGWTEGQERWLYLAAHDDDIVAGAGLSVLAAVAEGVDVHAVIATDGSMGYCHEWQRDSIAQIRRQEACNSFGVLGLPESRLHFLGFPDGGLGPYQGRRFTNHKDPTQIAGATGLQNSFPYVLRKLRPNRVFLPTSADLHPDHRIVHHEMLISLFHAQGNIWPELGEPMPQIPAVYEYATYCDFPAPPQLRIQTPAAMLETKLRGILAYASQEQIDVIVDVQRKVGPVEYLRELNFHFYDPLQYARLFDGK